MYEQFRRYPRYPISTEAVVTRKDEGSSEGLTTQVVTISQGGMGIYTNRHMEKATPISVELLLQAHNGAATTDVFEGRIASVCSLEKDYFVGIAFDREIAYDRFMDIIC